MWSLRQSSLRAAPRFPLLFLLLSAASLAALPAFAQRIQPPTTTAAASRVELGIDTLELAAALARGRDEAQLVTDVASVTAEGVLLDFGEGRTILLEGLNGTTGLADYLAFA